MKKTFQLCLTCLLLVLLLCFFRRESFFIGRIINESIFFISNETVTRVSIQALVDLLYVLILYFAFSSFDNFKRQLNIFILFPLLTDISDIFYDKTCWKPWINFYSFIWYFPLRLVIWIIVILLLKSEIKNLFSLKKSLFLFIVIIGYTILKPF